MPLTGYGYLKIEDIPGESLRDGHEGEIEIVGADWNVERLISARAGRGRARSRAEVDPMGLMKGIDRSSPYLAKAALNGKSFPEAVLTLSRDGGEEHLDYLVITMENVVLASYGFQNEGLEDTLDVLQERIELVFENITYKYVMANGDEHEITHDIAAGV